MRQAEALDPRIKRLRFVIDELKDLTKEVKSQPVLDTVRPLEVHCGMLVCLALEQFDKGAADEPKERQLEIE